MERGARIVSLLSTIAGAITGGHLQADIVGSLPDTAASDLAHMHADLDSIKTAVEGATPAGTAIIGKVGIDKTTPGTTNQVTVDGTGQSADIKVSLDSETVELKASTAAIGKVIAPTFSVSDSFTRPANTTAYAANKSMNCNVTVTAMSYSGLTVTLTANNAFAVGDRITVAGVNTGFTATNIDGNWICKTGTNATTVVFDVAIQPTGTTPQTVSAGTIAKCLSLDVSGVNGGGVILSRISVALPGVAMTGAVRCWIYSLQPTVLVDQATFTLLAANDTYRRAYVDLYPVTAGSGSDMCFAEWIGWMEIKPEAADTRLYFRLESQGAGTPTSAGVATLRASGIQLLG